MKVKVRAFGDLIPLLGNELTIELEEEAEISDLIQKISEKTEGFKEKIEVLSKRGITDSGLVILLNGRNINLLNGEKPY